MQTSQTLIARKSMFANIDFPKNNVCDACICFASSHQIFETFISDKSMFENLMAVSQANSKTSRTLLSGNQRLQTLTMIDIQQTNVCELRLLSGHRPRPRRAARTRVLAELPGPWALAGCEAPGELTSICRKSMFQIFDGC